MNYLGEYQKESTILLELLILDENSQGIQADSLPVATFEYINTNGRIQVENVTLDTALNSISYEKYFKIPDTFKYGEYIISYLAIVNGEQFIKTDRFYLSNSSELKDDQYEFAKSLIDDIENDAYLPSHYEQIATKIEANGHELNITISENVLYNYTYKLVINGLTSVNGETLPPTVIDFKSLYKPLFSTPSEVESTLRGLYKYFSMTDVYIAIRDASRKGLQLLSQIPDPNNSRYKEYAERNTQYFALTKYVLYEACINLLNQFIAKFFNNTNALPGEGGASVDINSASIALGDFSFSGGGTSTGSSAESETTEFLKKLNPLINNISLERKFWMDSMMSRNRRGYANAVTASIRTDAGSPESREF